jgi:hypothetical protein
MARVLCWITVAFLGSLAVTAHAASDWIDELPTVTAVAHAVAEQLKIDTANWRFDVRGITLEDDDDLFAVYVVGTLVLLRQIILYKYQEEKSLSPEREAKLRSVVAAYLEAELLIGKGVVTRRGYLTTAQKCGDTDCKRRWFKIGISNVGGASYRRRILPRLFPCDNDLAAGLDRLAQSYAVRAPYLPSPAVTLTIEPELACVAPKGCSGYGGDADGNGLCDDWQSPPPTTPGSNASASACPAIASTKEPIAPGGKECSRPGQPVFDDGGQQECENCENQWMEVRTGVSGRQEGVTGDSKDVQLKDCDGQIRTFKTNPTGRIDGGISIRVKCAKGHVVQFVSREYWLTSEKLEGGQYGVSDPANPSQLACFDKTTDTNNRKWRTDSRGKPNPYYESGGGYATSCDSMTTIDAPSVDFDPQKSKYQKVRVVAKSFAVCDGKVVSVVDWSRERNAAASKSVYRVDPPREPTPAEIKHFRGQSCGEEFNPWP